MTSEHAVESAREEHFNPYATKNWKHLHPREAHMYLGALARRGEDIHNIILPEELLDEQQVSAPTVEQA